MELIKVRCAARFGLGRVETWLPLRLPRRQAHNHPGFMVSEGMPMCK